MNIDNNEGEHLRLIDKVLNMLGETREDIDRINVGENGEILLIKGKLNTEKFVKMAMNY